MENAEHYIRSITFVSDFPFILLNSLTMLFRAILTILQIDAAASDPVTRYCALFSLVCALMSLLFGCMYIIRFGNMRKTYRAAEWALVSLAIPS
jgi:hypothetical protein